MYSGRGERQLGLCKMAGAPGMCLGKWGILGHEAHLKGRRNIAKRLFFGSIFSCSLVDNGESLTAKKSGMIQCVF